jgi:hypothetical protein
MFIWVCRYHPQTPRLSQHPTAHEPIDTLVIERRRAAQTELLKDR